MVIAAYRLLHSRKEMAMVSVFLMAIKPSSRASLVATFPSQCMGMEEMGASLGLVSRVSSAPARLSQRSAAITAPSPAPGPRPRPGGASTSRTPGTRPCTATLCSATRPPRSHCRPPPRCTRAPPSPRPTTPSGHKTSNTFRLGGMR